MLLLTPAAALADSDGYFCVGPSYLAFETRGLDSANPEHRIHIVSIGPNGKLGRAHRAIPDFQVHGIKCESDTVLLDGWDRIYEINIFIPVDPVSAPHRAGQLRAFPALNLAEWNRAAATGRTQRLALPWPGSQLEIINRRGAKRCEYEVETRIVRGPQTLPLLKRTFERDCG